MIVVVGGIKGGTGKSTVSTNLTVLRSSLGKRVLLVDADDQQSSCIWSLQRQSENIETPWVTIPLKDKAVKTEILKIKHNFDDVIVDVGATNTIGQRAAILIADFYLIPFQPRSLDVWTVPLIRQLSNEASSLNEKLKTLVFINRGDSIGSDNAEAMEILKNQEGLECLNFTIGNRKSFANASSVGLGVTELKLQDRKAISEIWQLHDSVW